MSSIVSPSETGELIAEHLGLDLHELKLEQIRKQEAEHAAKLEAAAKAEAQSQRRKLEAAHRQFMTDWKAGHIVVSVDDKVKTKPGDLCKSGSMDTDILVQQVQATRWQLLMRFTGLEGVSAARTAATLTKNITCTCGQDHRVEVFVTSHRHKV